MKRLDGYIGATVSVMMGFVLFALLGTLTLFAFLDEMEGIEKDYHIVDAAIYVGYTTPRRLYDLIPFSALIGCLLGLGSLANNSELTVMRSAGVSTFRISWSAIKPALVFVVFALLVGEYVVPYTERVAQHTREIRTSDDVAPEFGFWYREGDVFMHFAQVLDGGVLVGVSHYEFDDERNLRRSLFADRAVFHDVRKHDHYWLLENVTVTILEDDKTRTEKLTSLRWDTDVDPDLLSSEILVEPDKLSIEQLYHKKEYLKAQGLNNVGYELAFWRKTLQPLSTIALVFIAISFVFGPLREVTMGMRILAGLIIGIVFKFFQDLLTPASMVFGFTPILASLVPILLCIICGAYLIRRAG